MTWIQTRHGRAFDLLAPKAADVHVDDLAASLSKLCRFTGHTDVHYSVAQHCVHVSRAVPPGLALAGLLHDAAEAYVGDVSAPLKYAMRSIADDNGLNRSAYDVLEARVHDAVARAFGIDVHDMEHPEVKLADVRMLVTEKRDLMVGPDPKPWELKVEPYEWRLYPWPAAYAEQCFLERIRELT